MSYNLERSSKRNHGSQQANSTQHYGETYMYVTRNSWDSRSSCVVTWTSKTKLKIRFNTTDGFATTVPMWGHVQQKYYHHTGKIVNQNAMRGANGPMAGGIDQQITSTQKQTSASEPTDKPSEAVTNR